MNAASTDGGFSLQKEITCEISFQLFQVVFFFVNSGPWTFSFGSYKIQKTVLPCEWNWWQMYSWAIHYNYRYKGAAAYDQAKRRAHAEKRAATKAGTESRGSSIPCHVCGRICASEFGLRSHLRVHRWTLDLSARVDIIAHDSRPYIKRYPKRKITAVKEKVVTYKPEKYPDLKWNCFAKAKACYG